MKLADMIRYGADGPPRRAWTLVRTGGALGGCTEVERRISLTELELQDRLDIGWIAYPLKEAP